MAIMNPMYNERKALQERIYMARTSDEARYYEEKLYRLEREMSMMPHMQYEPMRVAPTPMPASLGVDLAAPETPLSFLKNADKKLLLTGAAS